MTTAKYYDRASDQIFSVELPEPGTVWERVPNIKDVLPKGMGMRVRDIPKQVKVMPNEVNPDGLTLLVDLSDGSETGFHPHWFQTYYKEAKS